MKSICQTTLPLLVLAMLGGCASVNDKQTVQTSGDSKSSLVVQLKYEDAKDDLNDKLKTGSVGSLDLKSDPNQTHLAGPYVSVARTCDLNRTSCKLGVIKTELKYTVVRKGNDWIIEGNMTTVMSRSESAENGNEVFSRSLPVDVPLLDGEPSQIRHFRWIANIEGDLELKGPGGVKFVFTRLANS